MAMKINRYKFYISILLTCCRWLPQQQPQRNDIAWIDWCLRKSMRAVTDRPQRERESEWVNGTKLQHFRRSESDEILMKLKTMSSKSRLFLRISQHSTMEIIIINYYYCYCCYHFGVYFSVLTAMALRMSHKLPFIRTVLTEARNGIEHQPNSGPNCNESFANIQQRRHKTFTKNCLCAVDEQFSLFSLYVRFGLGTSVVAVYGIGISNGSFYTNY